MDKRFSTNQLNFYFNPINTIHAVTQNHIN